MRRVAVAEVLSKRESVLEVQEVAVTVRVSLLEPISGRKCIFKRTKPIFDHTVVVRGVAEFSERFLRQISAISKIPSGSPDNF